jgi:hypothetical protein
VRDAIKRALASPPPRGAVAVVVVGLLVTAFAVLLTRNPGEAGAAIDYVSKTPFPESKTVKFGKGGAQIVDGKILAVAPNEVGDRLFTIETSLRANAGPGAKITDVRCQVKLPQGVIIGQSEGRRAAFPRPLANTADDAIKDGVPVDFTNGSDEQAGVTLRNNVFFKYVIGGDPSVEWSELAAGQHTWHWAYPKPVQRTRDNFAIVLVSHGGQTIPIACTPEAKGAGGSFKATARTAVKLP